ncbi:MAG: diaminopimelate epimerase [Bacteroidetes bacterium]|nr:diaminopimelate epimerase [Bacteroidota bacterium]
MTIHNDTVSTFKVPFTFMSGAGNTFYFFDNRESIILDKSNFTKEVYNSDFLRKADGCIFIENSTDADFKMHYFNSDGTDGMMCGNGGRCAIRFVIHKNLFQNKPLSFCADGHVYKAELINDEVILELKPASEINLNQELNVNNLKIKYHSINTGAPHCVIFLHENLNVFPRLLNEIDVKNIGKEIRNHKNFPAGINVNFCEVINDTKIVNRTYERGVEDETLACGTGSAAGAFISNKLGYTGNECSVLVQSGETLKVFIKSSDSSIKLQGSAHLLFEGVLNYDSISEKISL